MRGEDGFRDLYEILGVPRGADGQTLRSAYTSRSRELHPEVSGAPDAEERFRELSHAYDVLSKPRSRVLYDRLAYRDGNGNGSGGADSEELRDDELISWVFTDDRADSGVAVPRGDRLMRMLAAVALLVAIALILLLVFGRP